MKPKEKLLTKTILSRTDNLLGAREFVSSAARAFGFSEEETANIVLAVDEACTNIIKHAYQYVTNKEIEISILQKNQSFEVRIFDNGKAFDPSALRPPDIKEHIGHHRGGGLGVYMMKRLMDKVEYNFNPGNRNEVRLTKFRSRESVASGR